MGRRPPGGCGHPLSQWKVPPIPRACIQGPSQLLGTAQLLGDVPGEEPRSLCQPELKVGSRSPTREPPLPAALPHTAPAPRLPRALLSGDLPVLSLRMRGDGPARPASSPTLPRAPKALAVPPQGPGSLAGHVLLLLARVPSLSPSTPEFSCHRPASPLQALPWVLCSPSRSRPQATPALASPWCPGP